MSKNFVSNVCETSSCCPCGWLKKKVFGLSMCTWLIFFAILPYSAKGVVWTASTVSSLVNKATGVVTHREPPAPVVERTRPENARPRK